MQAPRKKQEKTVWKTGAVVAMTALLFLGSGRIGAAQDWAQWRGPRRDGHVTGFRVPEKWPPQLRRRWQITVGEGHSSPIIVGKRAYVLVRRGENEHTLCLNLEDGKVLWEEVTAAPFDSVIFPARRLGKSPRSTPLFHAGKLYTIGVNGAMTCFAADSGKVLWRKDFARQFKIPMPVCGASLSPLVDGKKIYVHVGHDDDGMFLALDKDTGAQLWAWKGEGPAYTSPQMATIGGVRQIVTASHNMWIALNPQNGQLLWSLPVRQNPFNHNSITPVIVGDTIVCGQNQRPTFALKIRKVGDKWQPEKVWETRDITMSTSSPVRDGARVYAVNEKRRGQIAALALDTGKVLWECPGNKGENVSLYDIGSHLLAFTVGGDLFVYRKQAAGLSEVAKYTVADSAMWASPAISGNRLLVKGAETLSLWEVPER
ncbi:MAG: PQQ-like beta-propeller repeat protein [Armatimonadaceae bacterium]